MVDPPPDLAALDDISAHLDAVEAALRALDDGSYGLCRRCRAQLPDQVLAADPAAADCGRHGGDGLPLSPP